VTSLVYVYAVLPRPLATDIKGINAQPLRWVIDDGLAAAVSDVPAEDFEEAPLNEHVRDLSWLGPRAVTHQEVNARLHEQGDAIIPLAFGTVFRDDDRVRQLLHHDRTTLAERLEAVRDRAEWVISLHVLREPDEDYVASHSQSVHALSKEIASTSPGRAHLLRRRLSELVRDERRRLEAQAAEEVVRNLREIASDVYLEPLPADTVERPLVRASVLVPRSQEARFVDELERLRAHWPEPIYRLLLTGPWPPYRFGGLQRDNA
jgi:hypothetical protein